MRMYASWISFRGEVVPPAADSDADPIGEASIRDGTAAAADGDGDGDVDSGTGAGEARTRPIARWGVDSGGGDGAAAAEDMPAPAPALAPAPGRRALVALGDKLVGETDVDIARCCSIVGDDDMDIDMAMAELLAWLGEGIWSASGGGIRRGVGDVDSGMDIDRCDDCRVGVTARGEDLPGIITPRGERLGVAVTGGDPACFEDALVGVGEGESSFGSVFSSSLGSSRGRESRNDLVIVFGRYGDCSVGDCGRASGVSPWSSGSGMTYLRYDSVPDVLHDEPDECSTLEMERPSAGLASDADRSVDWLERSNGECARGRGASDPLRRKTVLRNGLLSDRFSRPPLF
ncbi:hypothetical protein MCUN1_002439 [Malassezia cuniculi]|uniref:Uncharacterized protein n=1 Tax=Malassezia cuniculi TaxID=948313 RepID=A0AAF0ERJ3_9BASI|nr:hypothetical protein MCUN1_002439 [Malassezia cuniculi]